MDNSHDRLSEEDRSGLMSRVKSEDTAPEMMLRQALYAAGLRGYRVHADLPGSPDIAYTKYRAAIFVDGCFWHGCPKCYTPPKSNAGFWKAKLQQNRERDERVTGELREMGWTVIRVWEHEVEGNTEQCIVDIRTHLEQKGRR